MTGEELAAVVAVVTAALQPAEQREPERMPAWRRAMRLESTGRDDVR